MCLLAVLLIVFVLQGMNSLIVTRYSNSIFLYSLFKPLSMVAEGFFIVLILYSFVGIVL
jgi:hypothetical protein